MTARVGEPLHLVVRAADLPPVQCVSDDPLAAATKHPLTLQLLQQQLQRLGGTGFVLQQLRATIEGQPMVPLSVLGKLRRELVEQLQTRCNAAVPAPVVVVSDGVVSQLRGDIQLCRQPRNRSS